MRRTISFLITALNLGLTGPAFAHIGVAGLNHDQPDLLRLAAVTQPREPACTTDIFGAGADLPDLSLVDSITCLDQMCLTREVVVCGRPD